MADGLVGLQPHDAWQQDDRAFILRTLFGHQHLVQLPDNSVGVPGKDLPVDRLPATTEGAIPTQHEFPFVRFSLVILTENLQPGKDLCDELFDLAPFRVHKDDLLAHKCQIGDALEHTRLVQPFVHLLHKGDLLGEWNLEGVDLARAREFGLDCFLVREAHRERHPLGGGLGVVQGFTKQPRQIAQV